MNKAECFQYMRVWVQKLTGGDTEEQLNEYRRLAAGGITPADRVKYVDGELNRLYFALSVPPGPFNYLTPSMHPQMPVIVGMVSELNTLSDGQLDERIVSGARSKLEALHQTSRQPRVHISIPPFMKRPHQ